jgi:hypothetical protein
MTSDQADALREQAGLALLSLGRPDDALALLGPLAAADPDLDRELLQQKRALALMNATTPAEGASDRLREAEALLARLDMRHPGSGETLGLLGSAAKRMFRATSGPIAGAHLDRAIAAYLRGFTADPKDYYPGVNAVALLRARAVRNGTTADAGQARALLPVVRFMITRPGVDATVWGRATAAELLLHEHLLVGGPSLDDVVSGYAAAAATADPEQRRSMRSQLELLRAEGDPAEVIDPILAVVAASV